MISNQYIEKMIGLYKLSDKEKGDLLKQAESIDSMFAEYDWATVENAINEFYRKKGEDTLPRPAQVSAFIDKKAKRVEKPVDDEIPKPFTNIKIIQDCFYDICRIRFLSGIAYNDYFAKVEKLTFGNKMRLVIKTGATGEKEYKLINLSWLWDDAVVEAKKRFPDVFEKFRYATEAEKSALAYKMGTLKIDLTKGKSNKGA